MKNQKLISLALIAATSGAAAFGLANTELAARLPLDIFLAATSAAGVILFAIGDYSRRVKPLSLRAEVLRPAAPRAKTFRAPPLPERLAA